MKYKIKHPVLIPIYGLILALVLMATQLLNTAVTAFNESKLLQDRHCIVIDPGHGGIDGGATSCTGIRESNLNLQISIALNDLFHLLGIETNILRTQDVSIFTEGETIASQKISDLKERVRRTNETERAVLISIHQNNFQNSIYSGAQVFFAKTAKSDEFARSMQSALAVNLAPENHRKAKRSVNVYLLEKIQCPGILIECGFLSNPVEEAKLRSVDYQKKLCCTIAATTSTFLYSQSVYIP